MTVSITAIIEGVSLAMLSGVDQTFQDISSLLDYIIAGSDCIVSLLSRYHLAHVYGCFIHVRGGDILKQTPPVLDMLFLEVEEGRAQLLYEKSPALLRE